MKFGYTHKAYDSSIARTMGRDVSVSTRQSIEVANAIRGKPVAKAITLLTKVTELKQPIRYTKRASAPHKKGFGPGKYPINCAQAFIRLIKQAQANAQVRGLNTQNLEIIHVVANQASRTYRYGRRRRIQAKRTHIELIVSEPKKVAKPKKQPVPSEKTKQTKQMKKQ